MTFVLAIRWAKHIATAAFVLGVGASVGPGPLAVRRAWVHAIATPALIAVWVLGFALARHSGLATDAAWLRAGSVLGVVALGLAAYGVEREARPRVLIAVLVVISLLACFAVMVFKLPAGAI